MTEDNPTGRTTHRAPELQPVILGPSSEGVEPLREAFYKPRMQGLVSESQYTTHLRDAFVQRPLNRTAMFFHDSAYGRCNYAAIERSLAKSIGPRAPKRKRRKRLAKKIKQRGGMLKTCGFAQSYFDAWPEMRFWWGR